ncbi:LysM domain-containing protein [Micromonospora purpureochromogenes]|uniref:LysM domain-containing protein n=1 Tax=Micromonospora TaxID=1873 RepID=UPI002474C6FA|nr:LysM domain-containing protein [Micromonospora sp. A200]MDH6464723.1 nucleoid-associated protein YgaU [Micromonospora sp. A200]
MPSPQASRFAGLPILEVVAPDGARRHVLGLRLRATDQAGSETHRVRQGESIDLIARRRLGDEQLWWRVLDVNPLRYPLDLTPGEQLRLPDPGQATRATRARSF